MSLCLIVQLLGSKHRKWNNARLNMPAEGIPRILEKTMTGRRRKTLRWESEEEICSPGIRPGGSQPSSEEKTFLPIHATDSFTVVTGVRKFCCGMCGRAGVAVGSDNVCLWLCWGQRASSCALGQQSRELVWDAGFLLCLLLTKSNRGEIDFIYIYIIEVRIWQAMHHKQGKDVVYHSTDNILWGPSCGQRKFILCEHRKKKSH